MKPRGFTLFELVVVVSIIGVLALVLLDRLNDYQEAAEKTAMEQTLGVLRSAMHMQVAERLLHGGPGAVATLAGSNPMDWLAQPPQNYLGVRFAPKPGEVPGGHWYFDLQDHRLVYEVRMGNHFVPDALGRKQVRFELRPITKRTKEQGLASDKQIEGLVLIEAMPYRWF